MSIRDRLYRSRRVVIAAAVGVLLVTVANWPVRRLVGVNFVVSEVRLPLWAKAVDFIHRDANIDAVARAALAGAADDAAKAAAAFTWTRAHIRPQPESLPVLDDHIWHIIIRGYGKPDQRADVFTTLLAYADVPAYWQLIGEPPEERPLSYVWIRDRWRVYDVDGGVVFRNRRGDHATPEELAADNELVRLAATQHGLDAERYAVYFKGFRPPRSPEVSRADLQMPGRRLWHEMRKLIGVQGREWEMRPQQTGSRLEGQHQ
jgi:hypothetical protein